MLKNLNIDNAIIEKMSRDIPEELIKERDAGKGGSLKYVAGHTVIDLLNSSFGYSWSWEVVKSWQQESLPKFNKWAKIPEDQKVFYKGDKGAWEKQLPVAYCQGKLTVVLKNEDGSNHTIIKEGIGSKSINGGQPDMENAFKAAETDALKRAARLFGIGASLYRDENDAIYFTTMRYMDLWTDEEREKHKDDMNKINMYQEKYDLSEEALCNQMESIVGTPYVLPNTIKIFIEALPRE